MRQHAEQRRGLELRLRVVPLFQLADRAAVGLAGGGVGVHHDEDRVRFLQGRADLFELVGTRTGLAVARRVEEGDGDRRVADRELVAGDVRVSGRMSTAACSTPVRALIRLDLPELTCPTRATVTGCMAAEWSGEWAGGRGLCSRGLRECPAVGVGPAAEPAAVHFDQVKAHLPHETEINHGQQFLLDLGRHRVGREAGGPEAGDVDRVHQHRGDPRGVLNAAVPRRGRLQHLPLPDREEPAARDRREEPLFRVVDGEPEGGQHLRHGERGERVARSRVIVAGQGDSECLDLALVEGGVGQLSGRELADFLLEFADDFGRFLVAGRPMAGDLDAVLLGRGVGRFPDFGHAPGQHPAGRTEPPDLPQQSRRPQGITSQDGVNDHGNGDQDPQDEGPSGNHGFGSRWVMRESSTPFCNCSR